MLQLKIVDGVGDDSAVIYCNERCPPYGASIRIHHHDRAVSQSSVYDEQLQERPESMVPLHGRMCCSRYPIRNAAACFATSGRTDLSCIRNENLHILHNHGGRLAKTSLPRSRLHNDHVREETEWQTVSPIQNAGSWIPSLGARLLTCCSTRQPAPMQGAITYRRIQAACRR